MRIQWLRVLLGGLLIEVILAVVLIGGFAAAGVDLQANISTLSSTIIGVVCVVVAFLVVFWHHLCDPQRSAAAGRGSRGGAARAEPHCARGVLTAGRILRELDRCESRSCRMSTPT